VRASTATPVENAHRIRRIMFDSRSTLAKVERSASHWRDRLNIWTNRNQWALEDLSRAHIRRTIVQGRHAQTTADRRTAYLRRWSLLNPWVFGGRA